MDKDELQTKLSGYQPEFYRDDDPLIAEALRAVENTRELSIWLAGEVTFDQTVAQTLSTAQPPQGSSEALLSAYQETQTSAPISSLPKQRSWMRPSQHPLIWAAAAILLLSTAGLVKYFAFPPPVEFVQTSNPTTETLREQMAFFASERFVLDRVFFTNEKSAKWLKKEDYPTMDSIPGELVRYKGMGCRKISWQGHKVSLICFKKDDNKLVHLFIIDRKNIQDSPLTEEAFEKVIVHHERETMGWRRDENQLYLLVGSEPGVQVSDLLTKRS